MNIVYFVRLVFSRLCFDIEIKKNFVWTGEVFLFSFLMNLVCNNQKPNQNWTVFSVWKIQLMDNLVN